MPKTVDTMVKVKNTDSDQVIDFVTTRFGEIFTKVTSKPDGQNSWVLKGGSIMQPYGFKAIVSTEAAGTDATILKIKGRPKMGFLGYLVMVVVAVFLIVGLSHPVEGFWGLIAAIVFIISSLKLQKKVSKQLEQIASETTVRFS